MSVSRDGLKLSNCLLIAGGLVMLAGVLIVAGQAVIWLRFGAWYPISVATTLNVVGLPEPHPVQGLIGLQKIIDWAIPILLDLPGSAAIICVGYLLIASGEKQARNEVEKRKQVRAKGPPL
jgi:hypothetical protein